MGFKLNTAGKWIKTAGNRGFAPGGVQENLKRMEILTIFMDGLKQQECSSSARCKAPER